ncbi:MAG: virulence RhuM family protein [Salinivirgaceae bacterium]
MDKIKGNSEIILYQTEDGTSKIQVRLENETVWLSQAQIGELFQKTRVTITEHIGNIFKEGELEENSVSRKFRLTASDGKNYDTTFYNLDVIISVGYRVKSHRGTQFRIWATQRLREYIVKGFVMNDELLKQAGGGNYFDELLARIRDIRSSEKVFWRKVLDIYATSIDYNPNTETSITIFKTIQNKMHWAAHGNTAAEVIYQRVNADKPNLGLTIYQGEKPTLQETEIAKNYLNEQELNVLNRMVTAYLELAELQALNQKPMYMNDWMDRLNDFLKMSGREILTHSGKISHQQAIDKAKEEYEKYKDQIKNQLSKVENDFIQHLEANENKLKRK